MSPYLEQTSKIATSAGCLLRRGRNIHRFDTFGKFVRWPSYSYASTNLVIDYGTTAEAVFAFCLQEGRVWQEWSKERRRHGLLKAVSGFMLGCYNVMAFCMLGDAISFWAYSALRHVAMPAFPAMTLSLWAGSMAVRSAARYLSVRRCTAACGDACVSLAKANCAALLMLPRPQSWRSYLAKTLGAFAWGFAAEIATALGLEGASRQKMLAWLLQKPVRMPDHPILLVGPNLEEDMEEVGCHDLKCPITFGLLAQPVEVHGKVYEQRAVLEWIRMHHTAPHSPRDVVYEHSMRPCWRMQRLLRDFREEFRYHLAVGAVPGKEETYLVGPMSMSVLTENLVAETMRLYA